MNEYSALWNLASDLVRSEKWDQLEELAAQLRKGYPRWPAGKRKLDAVYDGAWLGHKFDNDAQFEAAIAKGRRWIAAKPESCVAKVQLAKVYWKYGWRARGGGYANTITPEGGRLFSERLAKDAEILAEAEKLEVKDPDLYLEMLNLSGSESGWNPELEKSFKKAVAMDPLFYRAYFRKAHYLLPRWGGEPGQWAAFAEESARQTESLVGWSLYARIVWDLSLQYNSDEMVKDQYFLGRNRVSWEKLKQGFEDIEKYFHDTAGSIDAFCSFACLAGDRETAHRLFEQAGRYGEMSTWRSAQRLQRWKIWADPETPKVFLEPRRTLETPQRYEFAPQAFTTVKFSPDGKWLAGGTREKAIVWNLETGKGTIVRVGGRDQFQSVCFSPDSKTLAVCASPYWTKTPPPGDVLLWDVIGQKEIATLVGASNAVGGVVFTPDGERLIATGGISGKLGEVNVWDLKSRTRTPVSTTSKQDHQYPAISRDGSILAVDDGTWISVMDVNTRNWIHKGVVDSGAFTSGLALSPDGNDLAFVTSVGRLKVIDSRTFAPRAVKFTGHGANTHGIAYTPDGKTIITSSSDESIALHDAATGRKMAVLMGHMGFYTPLDISADGKTLATAGEDGFVKLWDLEPILKAAQSYVLPTNKPAAAATPAKIEKPSSPTPEELAALKAPQFFADIQNAVDKRGILSTAESTNTLPELPQGGALLVGFNYGEGKYSGNTIIKSIQPIFLTAGGEQAGKIYGKGDRKRQVIAPPGYAVGAVNVRSGDRVDAIQVIFMKIIPEKNTLDAKDCWQTEWLGGSGGNSTMMGGTGKPVVGVAIRSGNDVDRFGLITLL